MCVCTQLTQVYRYVRSCMRAHFIVIEICNLLFIFGILVHRQKFNIVPIPTIWAVQQQQKIIKLFQLFLLWAKKFILQNYESWIYVKFVLRIFREQYKLVSKWMYSIWYNVSCTRNWRINSMVIHGIILTLGNKSLNHIISYFINGGS